MHCRFRGVETVASGTTEYNYSGVQCSLPRNNIYIEQHGELPALPGLPEEVGDVAQQGLGGKDYIEREQERQNQ